MFLKLPLLSLSFLFISHLAMTQSISFGLLGGVNMTSLNVTESESDYGVQYGVFCTVMSGPKIGTQVDLTYNRQFTKYQGETVAMNYVTVPVLIKYQFNPLFYLLLGPQFSFLAEERRGTDSIEQGIKTKFLGVCTGVGVDLPMGFDMSLRVNNTINGLYTLDDGLASDIVQLSVEMELWSLRE